MFLLTNIFENLYFRIRLEGPGEITLLITCHVANCHGAVILGRNLANLFLTSFGNLLEYLIIPNMRSLIQFNPI